MQKSFTYESEKYPNDLEVIIEICANEPDDGQVEEISVWNGDEEVKFESLSQVEQKSIEDTAQSIADENAYDLYFEQQVARAEAYSDYLQDR
jgi:hypothetical protein